MAYSEMNENRKAIEIASETYTLFPVGCVVQKPSNPERHGVVAGYGMGGFAIYGFNALSCLKVRWGGNKTLSSLHRDFVEQVIPAAKRKKAHKGTAKK